MKLILLIFSCLIVIFSSPNVLAQNISAKTNVKKIGINDNIVVTYIIDNYGAVKQTHFLDSLDFAVVLGPFITSDTRSYSKYNTTITETIYYTLKRPRHTGQLIIPIFSVTDTAGIRHTAPKLKITVVPGSILSKKVNDYDPITERYDSLQELIKHPQQFKYSNLKHEAGR